ncbi:hypothetical protein FRC02_005021 [Tulasnella sp. 418]|nr:hypothetical protein FRC02_005021 [Tulasnella sp. 418]
MDGLMIDSERVYSEVTNSILGRYGKEMTWDIKAGCMGKPERASCEYLFSFFPDIPIGIDDFIKERREKQDLFWPTVEPLPGILKLVRHLHAHQIPMAVATGSLHRNFLLKTSHLQEGFFGLFGQNYVCGDDKRLTAGKPAPDIFLVAAKIIGRNVGDGDITNITDESIILERGRGLVFEDATSGVQAAKRAGMNVVWVPDHRLKALAPEEDLGADQILESLTEFKPEEWGLPPYSD